MRYPEPSPYLQHETLHPESVRRIQALVGIDPAVSFGRQQSSFLFFWSSNASFFYLFWKKQCKRLSGINQYLLLKQLQLLSRHRSGFSDDTSAWRTAQRPWKDSFLEPCWCPAPCWRLQSVAVCRWMRPHSFRTSSQQLGSSFPHR